MSVGVHSTCSALAMEMAFPVAPPPFGTTLRNLLLALEFWYDNPLHLFLLAGPDYSQAIVETTNPSIWTRAQRTSAPHAEVHGFRTVGDIMTALNPLTGSLYLEGLNMTRIAREVRQIRTDEQRIAAETEELRLKAVTAATELPIPDRAAARQLAQRQLAP